MASPSTPPVPNDRDLVLDRLIDAPRAAVWRCWTEPELMKQWFAPLPWTTPEVVLDLRPGGLNRITMRSPEGTDMPNVGVYLEVVPLERLVFTDAYRGDWEASDAPFFTAVLTFQDEGGKTRYTATARHFTVEGRVQHEQMGFLQGWGICADQLEALARTL